MNKKQLLIIEDLGIPREVFEEKIKTSEIDYTPVWDIEKADNNLVEILVNVKKKIDADFISFLPNLKMIGVAFTGFDSVDPEACKEKNISVYNVPDYSTHSVAELVIGLSIGLLRQIPIGNQRIRQNQWELKPGIELHGKTVGIMGTGKIGLITAGIFKAMGCSLIGWSKTEKDEFKSLGGEYIPDKQEFFSKADIISIHLPSNQHTQGIVGKKELESMKKSAFLINTARGPVVDEEALLKALKNNRIAGAGLDVFSVEPIQKDHPFLTLENVILTPHIAYKTEEALVRRAEITIQNITDFLQGKTANKVN